MYKIANLFLAFLLAISIMTVSVFAAGNIRKSDVYGQSKLLTKVFSHDETGITDILSNPQNYHILVKFVRAATDAYIKFDFIPVREADTFVAVFTSIPKGITVTNLYYDGKNLVIEGISERLSLYAEFLANLSSDTFSSVTGEYTVAETSKIAYKIICHPA